MLFHTASRWRPVRQRTSHNQARVASKASSSSAGWKAGT